MEILKVDLSLEDYKGRIVGKDYSKDRTSIPLEAFPLSFREGLGGLYKVLTGQKITSEVDTFTVVSKGGVFKAVYGPTLMIDTEISQLVVRWGDMDIPLLINEDGNLIFKNAVFSKVNKPKISFVEDKFGEYKKTLLKVVLPGKESTLVTLIPVRLVDYREKDVADLLELMVGNNDIEGLANKIADVNDTTTTTSCIGPVIKAGYLPIGTYELTNYYSYSTKFGDQYNVQASPLEMFDEEGNDIDMFEAVSDIKNEDGEYVPTDVTVGLGTKFVIAGNSTIKTVFKSKPLVNDDKPAIYKVTDKGEYNNKPTAKGFIKVSEFIQDEDSFKTDW